MKLLKNILITLALIVVLLVVSAYVVMRLAFGPILSTYEYEIDNRRTLICEEEYNADFASVFYDVDFIVEDTENEVKLASYTFMRENWSEGLSIDEIGDWTIVSIIDSPNIKIVSYNINNNMKIDTLVSLDSNYKTIFE